MTEEIKCESCGKTFKTPQALAGHLQGNCGPPGAETGTAAGKETTRAVAKTGSLDAAIEKLRVPVVPEAYNGYAQVYWEGFNKGVSYGATTILVGIRSAQELSSLGISQATPIIKMAQEMRQAEGQAAQELAAHLGQVSMQGNQEIISAISAMAASQGKPAGPDPWQAMTVRLAEPVFLQVMQGLSASMFQAFPQAGMLQQPAQSQQPAAQEEQSGPAQAGPGDMFGGLPENITTHSLDELKEENR